MRTQYLNAVKEMYIALVQLRRVVGDYAPDESGDWREAVIRYGKGLPVEGEVGRKTLRDQRGKGAGSVQEPPVPSGKNKASKNKK